ncbi:MAG: hypothetical protein IJY65_05725 [Clostridia bacterium]|nr:hypothetical protein [Clostridia bacterium]
MNFEKTKRLSLICGIVTAALLVVCAISFIAGACAIYASGDNPYTYESIGRTFKYISAPVILAILAVIAGVVIHFLYPSENGKLKPEYDKALQIASMSKRVVLTSVSNTVSEGILRERQLRASLLIANLSLTVIAAGISLVYVFLPSSMTGDYNASVIKATALIALFFLPALAVSIVRIFLDTRSREREISLLRSALAEMKENGITAENAEKASSPYTKIKAFFRRNRKRVELIAKISLVSLALCLIVLGVTLGGMADVLAKAIKICTECIGLG